MHAHAVVSALGDDSSTALIQSGANLVQVVGDEFNVKNGTSLVGYFQKDWGGTCGSIAHQLLLPIITAELTFIGIRIAMKQDFTSQFVAFTRNLLIAYLIVILAWPQGLISGASGGLTQGAQYISKATTLRASSVAGSSSSGNAALQSVLGSINSTGAGPAGPGAEPYVLWWAWLECGDSGAGGGISGKFSIDEIIDNYKNPVAGGPTIQLDPNKAQDLYNQMYGAVFNAQPPSLWDKISSWFDTEINAVKFLVMMSQVSQAVTVAQQIATYQVASYLIPVIAHISICLAAQIGLQFFLGLGVAVMPLMFFKSFGDIYAKYLIFCTGVALIPSIYYMMAGMGFSIATGMYDGLMTGTGGQSMMDQLQLVMTQRFFHNLAAFISFAFPGVTPKSDSNFAQICIWIGALNVVQIVYIHTVFIFSVVSVGVSFTALSPGVALAWHQAFSSEAVITHIASSVESIMGSLVAASGQLSANALRQSGSLLSGAIGGMSSGMGGK